MQRNSLTAATSAWALVAYLGFLLFAAPCTCASEPAPGETKTVCCCGPDAKTPCAPPSDGGSHHDCGADLGAGCAQALPEAQVVDTPVVEDEVPPPALVLTFELASPDAVLVRSARAGGPLPPAPRLDQVRSTVLLI